ncbi:hypothetical protein GJQ57_23180 [Ralstonia pickettii]|uniref:Uncharacterized protein n=1 Tax=Ralstonia pickettii TaxID=329 RepID=A0A7X2HS34_RALPI|nr:hypothetical protein [Ralstonia pickettii]MRT01551.1 hypothetical protein [Ralstonia pickettii]
MNWLLSIESKVSLAVNAVNIAGLEKILRDNLFLVKITKEQDDSLTELGLRDRMPADNWSPSGSGSNLPWDRYNELGIEIVECDGPIFRRSRKIKVVSAEHSRSR